MLTLGAVLLALLVLPSPWGALLVAGAAVVDLVETVILVRWSRRRRPVTGADALVGSRGVATTRLAPSGSVRVRGELWAARVEGVASVDPGVAVVVEAVDGLVLVVRVA